MKTQLSFQDRLVGLQSNLLNFAYQLTTNRQQAEDLLQDTTLKALDNQDKYVDNVNFKGWMDLHHNAQHLHQQLPPDRSQGNGD